MGPGKDRKGRRRLSDRGLSHRVLFSLRAILFIDRNGMCGEPSRHTWIRKGSGRSSRGLIPRAAGDLSSHSDTVRPDSIVCALRQLSYDAKGLQLAAEGICGSRGIQESPVCWLGATSRLACAVCAAGLHRTGGDHRMKSSSLASFRGEVG